MIGKQSRHLGLGRGVFHAPEFSDFGGDDDLQDVIDAVRRVSKETAVRVELREAAGVGDREFAYWLSGNRKPSSAAFDRLLPAVAQAARRQLRRQDAFGKLPRADLDVIAAFLDTPESERRCQAPGCGKPLLGRATKWCPGDACRKRAASWTQTSLTGDPE